MKTANNGIVNQNSSNMLWACEAEKTTASCAPRVRGQITAEQRLRPRFASKQARTSTRFVQNNQ